MKKLSFVFVFLLSAGLLLAGCVASPPTVTPTPTPTVYPTVSPTLVACTADAKLCPDGSYVGRVPPSCDFAQCPAASPIPGLPEKAKYPLVLTEFDSDASQEGFSIRILSPKSFELTANVFASTPCSNTTAYWNGGADDVRVYFKHELAPGLACADVLKMRGFKTTVDYSPIALLRAMKSVKVYNFDLVGEKKFEGMFCGGIAAFQCPYAFDCKLDGGYPDAGGKCVFNASVYSGPRPA